MDEGRGPAWLTSYYERTQADSAISFRRRDNVTNWSYGIMAAAVGAYADSSPTAASCPRSAGSASSPAR